MNLFIVNFKLVLLHHIYICSGDFPHILLPVRPSILTASSLSAYITPRSAILFSEKKQGRMQKAKKGEFALHEDLKTDEDWQEIQEKKVGLLGHRVLSNPGIEIER